VKVEDLVRHILRHVNAEAATRDSSQVAGVAARAQYVQDTVSGFKTDTRDLSKDAILAEVFDAASLSALQVSFQNVITNTRVDDGIRPQLSIQAWVGKNREPHSG
jgi:hypothetical protein